MIIYDKDSNELVLKRKIIKDDKVNILEHLFKSHERYRNKTIYTDTEYLINRLENLLKIKFKNVNVLINKNPVINDIDGLSYYPVTVNLTMSSNDANFSDKDISFVSMNIPAIDNKGLINVRGKKLVCVNELNKAQDLSVDEKGNYQLKTLERSLNFNKTQKNYFMNFKGVMQSCTLAELAVYVGCVKGEININEDISGEAFKYIINKYSSISIRIMAEQLKGTFASTIYQKVKDVLIYTNLFDITLGNAREYINEYFLLDKVLGQELAEDIRNYKKGDIITVEMLKEFKILRLSKLFIKYKPKLNGYFIGEEINNITIPQGTKVTKFLLQKVPELKGYGYVPKAFSVNIGLIKGNLINDEINSFIHSLGLEKFKILKSEKSKDEIVIYFHKEVLTNFGSLNSEVLTIEDMEALISYLAGTMEIPELYKVYRRDIDFLKSAYTFADTLSIVYRRIIRQYISSGNSIEVKSAFSYALSGRKSYVSKLMTKIIDKTFDTLYFDSYYNEPDYKNPAALAADSRKLITMVSDNSATMSMRAILMGHYGRLCPFDTPQSAKIGLTNNIAVRAKIKNGILTTPYHPVIKKGNQYFISTKIRYLKAKDEFKYKIGDILMLEHADKNVSVYESPIINTIIQARVPAIGGSDSESVTIESIPAHELDFVNVYQDQLLSHCASLIPFLGADDGARITFASSMMRQAEAVLKSEQPYVYTGMYRWLVEDMGYVVKAEKAGVIKEIDSNALMVLFDDGIEKRIPLKQSEFKTGNLIVMETRYMAGDKFEKGDILAENHISRGGMFTPGINLLTAYMPYYGYNNEDGLVITQKAAEKYTSVSLNRLQLTLKNNSKNKWKIKRYINTGEFVNINQDILRAESKVKNVKPQILKGRFGKSGILQSISKEVSNEDNVTYNVNIISFDDMLVGDKMSGRHGNKGVVALVEKNSKAPSFLNGEIIDIILNPCGVPSRMNLGQMLEAHLGFVCYLLNLRIRSDSFNGASVTEIKQLLKFCYDLSNTDNFEDIINKPEYKDFPNIIKKHAEERFEYIKSWKGCFEADGTAFLINNRNGKRFANKVVIGCSYFMKLSHEVEHKRAERSGVTNSTYAAITKQPMKGSKKKGGQTIGEMEMWAIVAQGASSFLLESLHDKSDNVYMRNAMMKAIKNESEYKRNPNFEMYSNHGTEMLRYLIEGMNGNLKTNIGTDLSLKAIIEEAELNDNNSEIEIEEMRLD